LRQAGGGRCSYNLFFTVISVHAPIFRASRHKKEKFWNDLQQYLAAATDSDRLLMLGDFNARVNDAWSEVLGFHGLDVRNQSS